MNFTKYVNIKQGTKSVMRFSNGNTLPLVQKPFGFASFAPQTDSTRGAWFYHPEDNCIEGIRLTHQPSPWINDYGTMVVMPQSDMPKMRNFARWSGFNKSKTVLEPHYMSYYIYRSSAAFELTPTTYGAVMRVEFDDRLSNYLSVLPVGGKCSYEFDKSTNTLYCCTDFKYMRSFECDNFKAYFVFKFDNEVIDVEKTLVEDENGQKSGLVIEGENTAIHLALKTKKFTFTMATSYISYNQAELNLENDREYADFDDLKEKNFNLWNKYLSRIQIDADENTKRTFYSCLYRTLLFPNKAYEINEKGEAVHFAPSDGTVKKGVRYTNNGFWDTYRTVYPLLSIIAKDECKEMLEGFIQDYKDGGWLPCWTALDAKNCMPSTLVDAVIADAAVKGLIGGELLETAFEGMEKHANNNSTIPAYGRDDCEEYVKYGYVPYDNVKESVNLTLDAAYCDWCLAVVADKLGYKDKKDMYLSRSKNYANIFCHNTGFMRAKDKNGKFREDFDPVSWGRDYTEASAWQTTFAVQHDFEGLAQLYGGVDKLVAKLDEFFQTPPSYRIGGYGGTIHEMSEMMAGNWGLCAISNQPSFHIPFIYAYFGKQEKTSYWVHKICEEGFSFKDDGLPGDEDNGTMAAWYIFACLGFYPLTPGKDEYVCFKPYVKNIKLLGREINTASLGEAVSYRKLMEIIGV